MHCFPNTHPIFTKRLSITTVFLALAAVSCASSNFAEPQTTREPRPDDIKVLFIGSSYFAFNDLPGIFEQLALESGKQVFVLRDVYSGYYLDHFAESGLTEFAIGQHGWDYVVLQGGCQNAAYPDTHHDITPNSGYHPVLPALAAIQAKVEANNSTTKTVYMMPWAFEDGMIWVQGQTDTYEDMQRKIYDNTLRWADSLDLLVAPVGWAWREVLAAGQPQHFLHTSDWNHPNYRGSYLSASVVFVTVFAEGLDAVPYYGNLSASEALVLQQVASRMVLDDLDLWNIR